MGSGGRNRTRLTKETDDAHSGRMPRISALRKTKVQNILKKSSCRNGYLTPCAREGKTFSCNVDYIAL